MIRNRIIHLKICNPSVTTSKFRSPVSVNWCFLGGHLHNIRRATMLKTRKHLRKYWYIYTAVWTICRDANPFQKKVNILLSFSFHSYCYFTYSCLCVSLACLSIVPDLLSQVCWENLFTDHPKREYDAMTQYWIK